MIANLFRKINCKPGRFGKMFRRTQELECLISYANYFKENNRKSALIDLQRLVLRQIQSKHMIDVYLKPSEALKEIDGYDDFGLNLLPGKHKPFLDFLFDEQNHICAEDIPVAKLGTDIVLPTCWNRSSILNLLGRIGHGRDCGEWKQDSNHRLSWWYPLNIFWVNGGNHSITQGIIIGEGVLNATEGIDLSSLYELIYFDGRVWRDNNLNKYVGMPRYKELGYVFEIGRLIFEIDKS